MDDDFLLSSASAFYGVKFRCRCLESRIGEHEKHQFMVGTLSLKDDNEVSAFVSLGFERVYVNPSLPDSRD